jgi:SAM-dependent methyltransferase
LASVSTIERSYHDSNAAKFGTKKLLRWARSYTYDPLWRAILPTFKGKEVLDVGCGLGFDSVILARLGFHVKGIDISPVCVERARILARATGVSEVCKFEVVDLNFNSIRGDYDVIFGRAVLHHLTVRPLSETLSLFRSVMRPDGRMIFLEPLSQNPVVNFNRNFFDKEDRTPTEKPLDLWKALESFRNVGLETSHKEYYLSATMARGFRRLMPSNRMYTVSQDCLDRFDGELMKALWPLQAYAWIAVFVAKNRSRAGRENPQSAPSG